MGKGVRRGRAGAGAVMARCLWQSGIAFTDSGAAAAGLPQPAHSLEAWNFSLPWQSPDFDRYNEFVRGWQRWAPARPLPPAFFHRTRPSVRSFAAPLSVQVLAGLLSAGQWWARSKLGSS